MGFHTALDLEAQDCHTCAAEVKPMTLGGKMRTQRRLLAGVFLALAAGLCAAYPGCSAGDDSGSDVPGGCTLENCMNSCFARGLPGGVCDGNLCICNEPGADGDGDGDVTDGDTADRPDVRDDGRDSPPDEGGEATEDGETGDGETAEDVRDDAPREDAGPRCTDLAAAWTFNRDASGWTHGPVDAPATGEWDPWVLGVPTAGPAGCHGGGATNQCWTTGLAGSYPDCQRAELRPPTRDMTPCASASYTVTVAFWQWYDFASGDGGLVEVSGDDGATWVQIAPSTGWDGTLAMSGTACEGALYTDGKDAFLDASGAWVQASFTIPAEYLTSQFAFRLVFGSDGAGAADGWFVDDVALVVR
jgi:hypothetical protein